jgi:hypothetical protein
MIKDTDAYASHQAFMYKVWGVVKNDEDSVRNASKTAWEIIESNEGHRPKLRILNIFSLAQFSNLQDDITRLERLKKNNLEKKEKYGQAYDEYLTEVIDQSIKLIKKRINQGIK